MLALMFPPVTCGKERFGVPSLAIEAPLPVCAPQRVKLPPT